MNKLFFKTALLFSIILSSAFFSACSSDDDDDSTPPVPTTAASQALAGTYKGTLDNITSSTYDVILTVTDMGNGKVKLSTNKGNTTPKTVAVKWNGDISIIGQDAEGIIVYTVDNKLIKVVTNKTAEGDVQIFFEGTKQ